LQEPEEGLRQEGIKAEDADRVYLDTLIEVDRTDATARQIKAYTEQFYACSTKLIQKGQLDNYNTNAYFLKGLPKHVRNKVLRYAKVAQSDDLAQLPSQILMNKAQLWWETTINSEDIEELLPQRMSIDPKLKEAAERYTTDVTEDTFIGTLKNSPDPTDEFNLKKALLSRF